MVLRKSDSVVQFSKGTPGTVKWSSSRGQTVNEEERELISSSGNAIASR